MGEEFLFAIASSGVVAEKTGSALEKYNRTSLLVRTMVELWQNETGGKEATLFEILDSSHVATEKLKSVIEESRHPKFSPNDLLERLEHFEFESYLLIEIKARLDASTAVEFGQLAVQSHRAADRLLKNQTPETNGLVEMAIDLGALGASAFGAGFGGSVWALIETSQEVEFLKAWEARYGSEFPVPSQDAAFFAMRPGPPAAVFESK